MTADRFIPGYHRLQQRGIRLMLVISLAFGGEHMAQAQDPQQPMVLAELFTSQGCSSCPPADRLLGELAARPDVLALAYHVDYWDYLGWKDTFSTAANTSRQRYYETTRGFSVYTPQLVVEGSQDTVGSSRSKVLSLIEVAGAATRHAPVSLSRKPDGAFEISIGTLPEGSAAAAGAGASVLLLSYDARAETTISAGENSGSRIAYYNIVHSLRKVGSWSNGATHFTLPLKPEEAGRALAVIVQGSNGVVWGVARMASSH